ncbi:hypothetical protein RUND412_000895 [Rhizina undulata]
MENLSDQAQSLPDIPPDLDDWRRKLFHVTEPIEMTEQQSHRSRQPSKKGRSTHYYDCRLKGRPPGTPQNTDPNKKKRKRTSRERDLCDMKIKVTIIEQENGTLKKYLIERVRKEGILQRARIGDSVMRTAAGNIAGKVGESGGSGVAGGAERQQGALGDGQHLLEQVITLGVVGTIEIGDAGEEDDEEGAQGDEGECQQNRHGILKKQSLDLDKYGIPGLLGEIHRHTMEDSDRIKKSSYERDGIKRKKEMKKAQGGGESDGNKSQKTYHKKASGQAMQTVKRHSKNNELKLFGSCFCPFVQRVWIALEVKGLNYQYIEVDPYKKPQSLLEVNPRGLVPALKHGDWGCYESNVLLEYLEDLGFGTQLLPQHPQLKATSRLWVDHINRNVVPGFYRYLQAQEQSKQVEYAEELKVEVSGFPLVQVFQQAPRSPPFSFSPNTSHKKRRPAATASSDVTCAQTLLATPHPTCCRAQPQILGPLDPICG